MVDDKKPNPFGHVRSKLNLTGQFSIGRVTQNHSGSGHNIAAERVTFENSDRDLAQDRFTDFRAALLRGSKSQRYTIEHSMSDAEAEAFARQIGKFLAAHGFTGIFYESYLGGGSSKGQFVSSNSVMVGRR
jgi:hypothetical protein